MTGNVPAAAEDARKILFLGKRFYTNKDAWQERFGRVFHLPYEWARLGNEVLLLLLDYHSRERIQVQEGRLRIWSAAVPGLRVFRILVRAARFRPALVVASGDAYIGLLGWMMARLLGARFVFDIYDKYDEFPAYVRPLWWDLFGFLRRHADRRLFPSRSLARLYGNESGAADDLIVANGVEEAMFRPMPRDACRARLGLDPSVEIVGYFGSMEPDRGVADLIEALAALRARGRDIRLLVCGRESAATALDRDWIIYRGMVAHSEMPLYLNASDVLAIPYRISPFMDMGASCKIAEYLMCRRPIVSTRSPNFVGNFPQQAVELGEGVCDPGNPADLARAIAYQLDNGRLLVPPSDMTWPVIAETSLAQLRRSASSAKGSEGVP